MKSFRIKFLFPFHILEVCVHKTLECSLGANVCYAQGSIM
uniref:Uncharacterized protein n=1 Tax=Anguilla anguilla TaxID=7936 RepID=A0A0E9U3I5_ANGAN